MVWFDDRDGTWEVYFKRDTLDGTGLAEAGPVAREPARCLATPNPVGGGFATIRCGEAGQSPFDVAIRDATGRLLARRQVESSGGRLDLHGLAGGVYFLGLSSGGRAAGLKLTVRPGNGS